VGPSGARAAAFTAARGALVAIHDADDESRPDRLERQVAFLRAHPEIGVLGSAAEVIDERGDAIAPYRVPLADRDARRLLRRAPPFVHGSVLLRREAYEAAGGFRPVFRCAEDYDLWLRVPPRFGFANLPEPLYRWRLHGEGTFTRTRDLHLRYLAAARAFADERGVRGDDSAGALAAASSWDAFLAGYAGADRVALHWGEALVREGRTAEARQRLAPALRSSRSLLPAAGWWLLSWPVELLPRARRARAAAREAARPQAPTETSA
jgi:glycosyltransferase involved in cell wall biosynthesis